MHLLIHAITIVITNQFEVYQTAESLYFYGNYSYLAIL